MRVAPSITLPDELERARVAGELVVFAGAGVSMGPPAYLPNFLTLAREIAEPPLPLHEEDHAALDRYLGRAERNFNVRVQDRARAKLLERGGSFTSLHRHLLSLFPSADAVRLITTNFDPHFSDAACVVFEGARIREYVGPALPPGKEFRGIAQLHGSLENVQDRLVLTDRDFAAAYMTDGWAARFLVGVFAYRTVLFVGYSLTDPVMRYLLSAIPATSRWYSLTHADELPQWSDHDITPVTFATRADGDRFGELSDGLERWVWYATSLPSAHDRELRRLISLGPPTSPEILDSVRARLTTESARNTFWSDAAKPEWFEWVASDGFLDPLFDEQGPETPELVFWSRSCLAHFAAGEHPPLLRLVRRKSLRLHAVFARELVYHLLRGEQLPPKAPLRQFIALIVNQGPVPRAITHDPAVQLLGKLVSAGFGAEALAILRWMTQVRLEPRESIYAMVEEGAGPGAELHSLSSRVALQTRPEDLDQFLRRYASDLACLEAMEMAALGEQRLVEAYQLLELAKGTAHDIDWLSVGRTSIAASNQDSFAHAEDVLVVLVRSALDHWREHAPTELIAFTERFVRDERHLLKRLALYALAECTTMGSDSVLARAAEERWAGEVWVRPELYHLLKAHYVASSEDAKAAFVASLRDPATWGELNEHQAHARFSLSQLLFRLSPESPSTRVFSEKETATHPAWLQQDPDGFLSRIEVGWGSDAPSPVEPEQMASWSPEDALSRIAAELETAGRSVPSFSPGGAAAGGAVRAVLGSARARCGEGTPWGFLRNYGIHTLGLARWSPSLGRPAGASRRGRGLGMGL